MNVKNGHCGLSDQTDHTERMSLIYEKLQRQLQSGRG